MIGWIILVLIFVFIILSFGFRIVRPTERGLVETLGKYSKYANPGFHILIPGIQRMIKVNVTERMAEVDSQEIITEDKLNAKVDLVIYYKVKRDEDSVKKSIYEVNSCTLLILRFNYFVHSVLNIFWRHYFS